MSKDNEMMRALNTELRDAPGNPNRGPTNGPRPIPTDLDEPRVMTREAPSMATPRQAVTPSKDQSIAQLLCAYAEEIAKNIEREADQRLSAARADNERAHQFADSVRRNGIGNL